MKSRTLKITVGGLGRGLTQESNLSGSSSQLTPLNIAEELRGRSVNYEIYHYPLRNSKIQGL